MRILDESADAPLDRVTLYLTRSEAAELRDSLEMLLAEPGRQHEHVPASDYDKEVTVAIYEPGMLEQFDERSKRLILADK